MVMQTPTHHNPEAARMFGLDLILALIGGAATATVVLMLAFTFHYRVNRQAAWEQLEQVGQFWNGMFSPFALFALITGLYFQQRQMYEQRRKQGEDRQHFQAQMNLLRSDLAQRSFELATGQLQEYATELLFEVPSGNGSGGQTKKGLGDILRLLGTNDGDDLLDRVVVDRVQLQRYMRFAEATKNLLAGLPLEIKSAAESYFEQLQPTLLSNMVQQLERARLKCLEWVQSDLSRPVDDEIRLELQALVDQEWVFDKIMVSHETCVIATRLKPGFYQRIQSRKMPALQECCREVVERIKHRVTTN